MTANRDIPCSVGILTFNSEKTLRRTLESVKNFSDIIISDSGSTDKTLAIAKEYNCRVIDQISKHNPGPEPSHPITDFSAEHNRMVSMANEDWYLRLDSDEYISNELRAIIADKVKSSNGPKGYRLPMVLQSPDGTVTYQLPKQIFQMRLFNLTVSGKFQRIIHERYEFDEPQEISVLNESWFVPISKPDFKTYSWAVEYRLTLLHSSYPIMSFPHYLKRGVVSPLRNTAGILKRLLHSYLFIPIQNIPPLYYFRNRLYSQWVTFKVVNKLYWRRERKDKRASH